MSLKEMYCNSLFSLKTSSADLGGWDAQKNSISSLPCCISAMHRLTAS